MSDLVAFLEERLAEDERTAGASAPRRYVGTSMTDLRPAEPESRALREVEAKRAMVARCQRDATDAANGTAYDLAREVLGDLAAVYADHPDYREEWRP